MELLLSIQRVLWVASLLAEALVFVRLLRERLLRSYPLFAAFLALDAIFNVVLLQIAFESRGYTQAFRVCTAIMLIFRLGMVGELYEQICKHFPGIGVFRAGMAAVFVLLAALAAVFTLRPNLADQWAFPQTVVLVVQRFQSEIFAGALLLTWLFLHFVLSIRQPFRPNVLNHWSIATIYFGASGVGTLATLLLGAGEQIVPITCTWMVVQLGCLIAWFRLMRRSGQEVPAFQRLTADQVRVVEQYNRELLGTVRSLPGEVSAAQGQNRGIPSRRERPR